MEDVEGDGRVGTVRAGDDPVLVEVMGRLAAGDAAALVTLLDRYRRPMAAAVRRVATARQVTLGPDEVDELVTDVAVVVARLAGSWSPEGGAAPWVWARHQVARVVDVHIGQFADPLDDDHGCQVAEVGSLPGAEPDVIEVLDRVAAQDPLVALLAEALSIVASPRDRSLFIEAAVQVAMGDRSPAKTVGDAYGVTSAAVRQQQRRVRLRVQRLAASDPRFAPLGDLAVVA